MYLNLPCIVWLLVVVVLLFERCDDVVFDVDDADVVELAGAVCAGAAEDALKW